MVDRYTGADELREVGVFIEHAKVLDVRILADRNPFGVTPDEGGGP